MYFNGISRNYFLKGFGETKKLHEDKGTKTLNLSDLVSKQEQMWEEETD